MAARLQLQQELAADALGARLAGGRPRYLESLSRPGPEARWTVPVLAGEGVPAGRGTLIRRIEMLKNGDDSRMLRPGRVSSKVSRLATALGLLALTIGVASWKAPARGPPGIRSCRPRSKSPPSWSLASPSIHKPSKPFEVDDISDRDDGCRRLPTGGDLAGAPGPPRWWTPSSCAEARWPTSRCSRRRSGLTCRRAGFLKLKVEDIESISCGFKIGTPPNGAKRITNVCLSPSNPSNSAA